MAAREAGAQGDVVIAGKPAPTGGAAGPYYLQLDIANFFNSIDRRTLFGLLKARVDRDRRRPATDPRHAPPDQSARMLWLARVLLSGNPALNARFLGRPADLARVPAHKQLINAAAEKGLPIGNLTSQFFANVYLNELDQFVKHILKARWYVRYVDDFVLLHPDPTRLAEWRDRIERFLRERLGLSLRDTGRLAPVANGIDFLGYVTRSRYRLVRRRVVGHMRERLAEHRRRIVRPGGALEFAPGRTEAIQAKLASYFGHFKHAKAARLRAEVFANDPWLGAVVAGRPTSVRGVGAALAAKDGCARGDVVIAGAPKEVPLGGKPTPTGASEATPSVTTALDHVGAALAAKDGGGHGDVAIAAKAAPTPPGPARSGSNPSMRLVRVDRSACVTSLASQWRYFHRRFPGHVALMRVGSRLEAYGGDAERIATATRCPGAPITRAGLEDGRAWPIALGARLRARLARRDVPYCQIDESGWLKGGMKRRVLRWLYPAPSASTVSPVGAALAASEVGACAGAFIAGKPAPTGAPEAIPSDTTALDYVGAALAANEVSACVGAFIAGKPAPTRLSSNTTLPSNSTLGVST